MTGKLTGKPIAAVLRPGFELRNSTAISRSEVQDALAELGPRGWAKEQERSARADLARTPSQEDETRPMAEVNLGMLLQTAKKMRASHTAQALDFVLVPPRPITLLHPDFPPPAKDAAGPTAARTDDADEWEIVYGDVEESDVEQSSTAVQNSARDGVRKAYAEVLKG